MKISKSVLAVVFAGASLAGCSDVFFDEREVEIERRAQSAFNRAGFTPLSETRHGHIRHEYRLENKKTGDRFIGVYEEYPNDPRSGTIVSLQRGW